MDSNSKDTERKLPRISMGSIWKDFVSMINFEKGALRTLKGLLLSPARTIDEYLHKDRSKHAHPMRLLIFSTAISTIVIINLSMDADVFDESSALDFPTAYEIGAEIGKKNAEAKKEINTIDEDVNSSDNQIEILDSTNFEMLNDSLELTTDSLLIPLRSSVRDSLQLLVNQLKNASAKEIIVFGKENKRLLMHDKAIKSEVTGLLKSKIIKEFVEKLASIQDKLLFLLVPLYAFGTFLFFRKKSKYNFAENLVVNAYLISFQNAITIAFLPLLFFFSFPVVSGISSVIALIFTFYFWIEVFKLEGFKEFVKSFFVLCFSYFFYILLIALILRYYLFKDIYNSLVS